MVNENNKLKSERIAALKEQNIELYMKLVSTEKNSRLMQILEQTHKYLQNLGSKVFLQKNDTFGSSKEENKGVDPEAEGEEITDKPEVLADENAAADEDNKPTDAERIKNNMRNSSKIYYKITHSKTEDIKEQPSLLKGG